ncbi:cache domain-containing protein [Desulfobacula sp.]|uniref:cache domain-containing protein n=1 Tax=Desulfobacula sp. TaxID=2593537 RepID=UPI002607FB82|nr:cache domain-containing protein [Desulfobacula sp.]
MGFAKLKFRNKLLFAFLIGFIPFILMGSILAYYQVKKTIQTSIENELQSTNDALTNLIKTSASVSIKNRLHAIAEKNLEIASYYYNKYQSGLIGRAEAIQIIEEIFLHQSVGISGYIYCLNSKGIVTFHPNDTLLNTDVSEFDFVRQQMEIKDGYLEYEWKNPGESHERAKALYMVYFKPLDWIISVSSYRDEFNYLVDMDDFRDSILSYKSGKTGYAYVLDEAGTILVHQYLQGLNLFAQSDQPIEFLKQILEQKNGTIKYFWKNPRESTPREKIVLFKHLPEYKWIVASSSYIAEVFLPLDTFRNLLIAGLMFVLLFCVGITYFISRSITKPLTSLMEKFEEAKHGDFSVRMGEGSPDEFGRLAQHFNAFMDRLKQNNKKIAAEIQKNRDVQAALVAKDLKLRSLFDHSFQLTGILSPSGIIEEVNRTGLEFAGCTTEDVVHRPLWQTPWWQHDSKTQHQLRTSIKKAGRGEFVRYETTNISKEGQIRSIDFSIKPIFNAGGEVAFLLVEGRDITAYKLAARERKNLAVQLEKSQKMEAIGTLSGGIAHDFNNILSGILGYAQLAELDLDDPIKARENIAQIIKGTKRAAKLTRQILTFSRQTGYEKHPFSLCLVVKEALKLLRSSIPTTIEISENIVSTAMVLADPTQIHQVMMNLCTNAYHAMEKTGGILTIRVREREILNTTDIFSHVIPPGRYLELEIIDTGIGMDEETLSKAFDPYFTTKAAGKGTGLGLSLVHAIVKAHGGYIKASSAVGQGTCFSVYLPVVDQETHFNPRVKQEKRSKHGAEKIMVVDDEKNIRWVIQAYLARYGYSISTFENGAEAFEAFERAPDQFDLIITDMTMPRMTGEELAKNVLRLRKGMPVILCTGYSETISEAKALEMGIRKYVQKPVSNEELVMLVREILDQPV